MPWIVILVIMMQVVFTTVCHIGIMVLGWGLPIVSLPWIITISLVGFVVNVVFIMALEELK